MLLVAVGAIVRFAATKEVTGINVKAVGVILMIIGAVANILSLFSAGMLNDFGVHGRCG